MFSFFQKKADGGEESGEKKRTWLLLIVAALGAALILFGGQLGNKEPKAEEKLYSPAEDEMVLYQDYLESRVKVLCESVKGVENVTAIVTLSGSFESVYATEWHDGNEEFVILGSGSNAEALFLTRNAPQIAGIGIVCRGGTSAAVRNELTALISAGFRIPTNRIYITDGKG